MPEQAKTFQKPYPLRWVPGKKTKQLTVFEALQGVSLVLKMPLIWYVLRKTSQNLTLHGG